ncbi:MAG TPA: class A beta-lactamase, partial [Woeseiaceae bacterium]
GRVGVMVLDTDSGETLEHRADERFAMCSTFKWVLAAAVLERVDHGELRLEQNLHFGENDLLDYAPVAREHISKGSLTIDELCAASVSISDNTAANLLLEQVGGPSGVTAFLRRHGDAVTRLDRNEPTLNTNLPGDPRDTTTPRAMVGTMNALLVGDALSAASRQRLLQWLKDAATGLARLRAGLPPDWVVGDKTGTGVNGAANDVAIAWPPGRAPILIASYLSDSDAAPDTLNRAHEAIGAAVAQQFA